MLCGVQVQGLGDAIKILLDRRQQTAVINIPWPASITATVNFSRFAASQIGTASPGRLQRASYDAILPDGSVVAISNREAEYLLRAERRLRQNEEDGQEPIRVAITNLAFVEWLHPLATCNGPEASQATYTHQKTRSSILQQMWAFGASSESLFPRQDEMVARNILAAQLFKGGDRLRGSGVTLHSAQ
jgi:hypothetical protein